jgi:hypothetical protein
MTTLPYLPGKSKQLVIDAAEQWFEREFKQVFMRQVKSAVNSGAEEVISMDYFFIRCCLLIAAESEIRFRSKTDSKMLNNLRCF